MKYIQQLIYFIFIFSIIGCTSIYDNLVYRMDISQGNIITEQDIEKLKKGMSKDQVEYILGKSVLNNNFDPQHWYYTYEMHDNQHNKLIQKKLIIEFDQNNKLKGIKKRFQ